MHQDEPTITTTLKEIYGAIDAIEQASNSSKRRYSQPTLEEPQRERIRNWCGTARAFVEEDVAGGLGLPIEDNESGEKLFIFPRAPYKAVRAWFLGIGPHHVSSLNELVNLPILEDPIAPHLDLGDSQYSIISFTVTLWRILVTLYKRDLTREYKNAQPRSSRRKLKLEPPNQELMEQAMHQAKAFGVYRFLVEFGQSLQQNWHELDNEMITGLCHDLRLFSNAVIKDRSPIRFLEILIRNKDYAWSPEKDPGHSKRRIPTLLLPTFGKIAVMPPASPPYNPTLPGSGFALPATRPRPLDWSLPSITYRKRSLYRLAPSL
ncbi:hypothetical protein JCM3765_007396 [Sporobolomyces pararoseus]